MVSEKEFTNFRSVNVVRNATIERGVAPAEGRAPPDSQRPINDTSGHTSG